MTDPFVVVLVRGAICYVGVMALVVQVLFPKQQ